MSYLFLLSLLSSGLLLAWAIWQARTIRRLRSEARRADDRERETRDRLTALTEASPLAIYTFDRETLVQTWNPAAERLFGWSAAEVIGKPTPIVPEGKQEEYHRLVRQLFCGDTLQGLEVRRQRRDGTSVDISLSAAPLRDQAGTITGVLALIADITDRKRAEDEKNILVQILEATTDFVGTADAEGHIIYHNQAFLALGGDDKHSVRAKTIRDFHPPWALELVKREGLPTALREGTWSAETAFLRFDGREIPISQVLIAHKSSDGSLQGISTIARDISERKETEKTLRQAQEEMEDRVRERTSDLAVVNEWLYNEMAERQVAEAALTASEERYRFLADSMPQIVWTSRPDGAADYYNQRWHEYTGLTLEETAAVGDLELIHPEDRQTVVTGWLQAMSSGQPYTMQYRLKRADGVYRWHLGRVLPLRDEAGKMVQWVGTGTDINDYKEAEEALRRAHDELEERVRERTEALHQEQEFLRALLDNLQEGIVACDAKGALTVFNQATRDFHGLPEEALPPGLWTQHYDLYEADGETPMPTENIPLFRAWHGEVVRLSEMVIAPKNGISRTLLANGQAIQDERGNILGAVVAMHDITERKAIDRMKNEFISVVSHELRTPLTSIRGALGLIAGGVGGEITPSVKKLVDIAHSNTERLVRLINDILDIEKMEAGKMDFPLQPVSLIPLVRQALDSLSALASQSQVALVLDDSLPEAVACAESDRLMQVLTNLLSNAVKFSPPGETVSVAVLRQGQAIRLTVRDRGDGIPADFQERVFQKFAQADSADTRLRGGTGLGLSICKGLVEKFGGGIGFTTEAGQGTTFYVDLKECDVEGKTNDRD